MKSLVVLLFVAGVLLHESASSKLARRIQKRDDHDDDEHNGVPESDHDDDNLFVVGVTKDHRLVYRNEDGSWEGTNDDSCCILSVATLTSGVVVAVGTDHQLYEWKSRGGVWSWVGPLPNSCCVKDISVTNSGALIGVTPQNRVVLKATRSSSWQSIPSGSCCVTAVENDIVGRLYGVATNGKVRMLSSIYEGSWETLRIKGPKVRDIMAFPNGDSYALSKDGCQIYHLDADHLEWGDDINDGTCLLTISALVNPEYNAAEHEHD